VPLSSRSRHSFAARTATGRAESDAAVTEERAWLSLPTGHVVAADPIALGFGDLPLPFAQTVPPGRYPVELRIEHGYVATARLIIRDEPATVWELTVPKGRVPGEIDPNSSGYEVESGMGCLADEQSFGRLCADGACEWQQDLIVDVARRSAASAVLKHADADDEPVLIAFRTGEGDGECTTWAGRNANGDVTCFVTDFFGPDRLDLNVTGQALSPGRSPRRAAGRRAST
jgi:hypothetical protein